MVDGYLGEPELTRRHFRNGWFYPGDMGVLGGPRRLRVIGRGGELLNIGGAKSRPDDLEAIVIHHVGADDVGICTLPNREGIEEIYVAVSGARCGSEELLARVKRAFEGQALGAFYVAVLPAIPRSAGGKIQRAALREMIGAMAGRGPRS
jgi:acyl-CoA synthetase (AMP-forming)/AMP-acid ligase II